jgi:hypothetical protein
MRFVVAGACALVPFLTSLTAAAQSLPPADVEIVAITSMGGEQTKQEFGSVSANYSGPDGTQSATAQALNGKAPSVAASGFSNTPAGEGGGSGRVTLSYYVRLNGPDGIVPVKIHGSGGLSLTGTITDVSSCAYLVIPASIGSSGVGYAGHEGLCSPNPPDAPQTFDISGTYLWSANTPMPISMDLTASTGATSPDHAGGVQAWVEPVTIEVDSSVAQLYTLSYSPGVVGKDKLPAVDVTSSATVADPAGGDPLTKVLHKFGTAKVSSREGGSRESATATATSGPDASVTASATGSSTNGQGLGAPDEARSTDLYAFRLVGAKGKVQVDYGGAGSITATPGSGLDSSGWVSLDIAGLVDVCAGDQTHCGSSWNGNTNFAVAGTLTLQANTVYYATLDASADAIGSTSNATVSSTAHGLISVNPKYAGQYTIEFSKGFLAAN